MDRRGRLDTKVKAIRSCSKSRSKGGPGEFHHSDDNFSDAEELEDDSC